MKQTCKKNKQKSNSIQHPQRLQFMRPLQNVLYWYMIFIVNTILYTA